MKRAFAYLLFFLACAAVFARGGSSVILFETKKYVSFFGRPDSGEVRSRVGFGGQGCAGRRSNPTFPQ